MGPKKFGLNKIMVKKIEAPQNWVQKFGQHGSVTAEIFLIWTDVARTNVAWTNFTVTDGLRTLPLMFGANWVSNSQR